MLSNSRTTFQVKNWTLRTTACFRSDRKCKRNQSTLLKILILEPKVNPPSRKLQSRNLSLVFKRIYKLGFTRNRRRWGIINLWKDRVQVTTQLKFSHRFCNLERLQQTKQDQQVANLQCFTQSLKWQMLIVASAIRNKLLQLRQLLQNNLRKAELWVLITFLPLVWSKKHPIKVLPQLIAGSVKLSKRFH